MIIIKTIAENRQWLAEQRTSGKTIGFVPTMGALHKGHLNLVRRSCNENDITGCSIFVNPIQFNNPEDLLKYPRTIESDLELLEKTGCDVVFIPTVEEMYPEPLTGKYDFGDLERVMEGEQRPGHFNGVATVVKKLFDIFQPDRAYFGEKDFQQLRIIQALVEMENIPVEIIPCATVREADGLAMSSRNRRLSSAERKLAPEIYKSLLRIREMATKMPVTEVKETSAAWLAHKGFKVDYFELVDSTTLDPIETWEESSSVIACVAAFLGKVRLIDNLILFANFAR